MSKSRIIALALLVGLIALLSSTPGSATATTPLPTSEARRLPTSTYYKEGIASSGSLVVWGDFRRGENNRDLYGFDLKTNREVAIAVAPGQQRNPAVSGDRIVWWDTGPTRSTGSDIYMMDYRTKETTVICGDADEQRLPAIDGDIVVWEDLSKIFVDWDDIDVVGMDLGTGERFVVDDSAGLQAQPDVCGDWVVYADFSSDVTHADIKAFNVRTKERKTLSARSTYEYHPRIGADGLVAWQEDPYLNGQNVDVRGCYVTGGASFTIASGSGNQGNQTVSPHLVVYQDGRKPGGYGMIGYDLLSNTRFGISPVYGNVYYVSPLVNGVMSWIGASGRSSSVYIARPTELDQVSEPDLAGVAVDASREAFPGGADTVVVTSAAAWQYPLMAQSVMAAASPVLITAPGALPSEVASELARLAPSRVVIVGGASVVGSATADQIATIVAPATVTRIDGSTARRTALRAVRTRASRGGWNGTVLVVSQSSWMGAMSASSVSATRGYPLVLVGSAGFTSWELSTLRAFGAKRAIVVGGTTLISDQLKRVLGSTKVLRLAGTSRYSTCAKVAQWAVAKESMRWNHLAIVSGESYGQSLLAGSMKARTRSVLLMTDKDYLSAETASALRPIQSRVWAADFVGNPTAVSKKARGQVRLVVR